MLGVVNRFATDGAKPLSLPDLNGIANILEIPMAPLDNIFDMEGWKADDDAEDDISMKRKLKTIIRKRLGHHEHVNKKERG